MSGIAILRRLLMKQAMKKSAPFQHEGIMSISKTLSGNVDAKIKKWVESAKRQGGDIDKMSEQEIKYLIELNRPKGPTIGGHEVIGPGHPRHEGITRDLFNMLDRQSGKNVIKTDFGKPFAEEVGSVDGTIKYLKTLEPMDSMKEANKVLKGEGRYKSLSKADRKKIVDDESVTDHIFERNIDPDPEDFAHGGRSGSGLNYLLGEDDQNSRVPFKKGHSAGRRKFLKVAAGLATIPVLGKFFKFAKPLAKTAKVADLTSIPIKNIDGMPAWFKPLVNKVIKEGEDVTKTMSSKEREIVHQVSLEGKISKDALGVEDIRVTQSLDDGTIRVQYNSPDSIGESGVELVYKQGEEIPVKVKGKNTSVKEKDKFTASEDDFYPQATSPDGDFDLEFTENIVNKVDDLYSDTSKLKQFATGKKPTVKEISESMKKKKILKEINDNPNEHAFRNAPDYDPYPEPDDFASGGRVPLDGGGISQLVRPGKLGYAGKDKRELFGIPWEKVKELSKRKKTYDRKSPLAIPDDWLKRVKEKLSKADGGRVSLSSGGLAGMLGE